ncbi:aspartic proteinase CDR1-like [Dioscorea cayenensis subsp. rotundata]|uniref:Aspartic proteinase CDR1-like n=1 Tax=Dioscorea cayennensis subsp. rotundata TaxID=55577 RepID=A0AB40CMZ5_DIOCR|nr:aspartic proteinase CDR1-like [Dioscorea cayenensis subsp. rotundata]
MHRDSPLSPHYQPSVTSEYRVKDMIERSISRARYISSIISSTSYSDNDNDGYSGGGGGVYTSIASSSSSSSSSSSAPSPAPLNINSKMLPSNGDYITQLEIGTPPVKVVTLVDTGSDLVWVQCKPCDQCYNQDDPIFDPSKSSTFKGSVSCKDDICLAIRTSECINNQCNYMYEYADGSLTSGNLSRDTFTFSSGSDDKQQGNTSSSIPGIVFGCSHNSNDTDFTYSTLNLGDNALVNDPGFITISMGRRALTYYTVKLKSIAVGKDTIPNDPFDTNILVDLGTAISFIPDIMLSKLIDDLSKMVNLTRTNDPHNYLPLCYSHSVKDPPYPFPDITFTFYKRPHDTDGESIVLTPMQAFFHVSDTVLCLAMHGKKLVGISVLGNIAQLNMHVGYDLHNNVLSMATVNCSKF